MAIELGQNILRGPEVLQKIERARQSDLSEHLLAVEKGLDVAARANGRNAHRDRLALENMRVEIVEQLATPLYPEVVE